MQNFGRENFDDSTCIRQNSSDFSTVKVLRYTVDSFDFSAFYFNNVLWDGAGCTGGSSCCDDTTQPWFHQQLNKTTQDDIEARICSNLKYKYGSTFIDHLEL